MSASNGSGLVKTVLAYVDRPWKMFAVVLLAVVGIGLYLVYQERARIAEAILNGYVTPRLLVAEYDKQAVALLQATKGDVTQLVKVELLSNEAKFLSGFDRNGSDWHLSPLPRSVVDEHTDPAILMRLIEGQTVCLDVKADSGSTNERAAAQAGISRACIVGVPPVLGILVGVLYVGWETPLPKSEERGASLLIRSVARKLAAW